MTSKFIWQIGEDWSITKVSKDNNKLFADAKATAVYAVIGNSQMLESDTVEMTCTINGNSYHKVLLHYAETSNHIILDDESVAGWEVVSNGEELQTETSSYDVMTISFDIKRFSTIDGTTLLKNQPTGQTTENVYASDSYTPMIEPSDAERIEALIAELNLRKQDKTDNSLQTTDKTVVGAINEVKSATDTNRNNITNLQTNKLDKNQGIQYAGQVLQVNEYGTIVPVKTRWGLQDYELISMQETLPIAKFESADFVQVNGKTYQKIKTVIDSSTITTLANTRWLIDSNIINTTTFSANYNINFISNNTSYTKLSQEGVLTGIAITYINSPQIVSFVYNGNWVDEKYREIEIIDGTDITNANLINWLQNHAELVSFQYKEIQDGITPATQTNLGGVWMWQDANGTHIWNIDPNQVHSQETPNEQGGETYQIKTMAYTTTPNLQGGLTYNIGTESTQEEPNEQGGVEYNIRNENYVSEPNLAGGITYEIN